jgi:hypothetical protein
MPAVKLILIGQESQLRHFPQQIARRCELTSVHSGKRLNCGISVSKLKASSPWVTYSHALMPALRLITSGKSLNCSIFLRERKATLTRREDFLVLCPGLHVVKGVIRLDIKRDRLPVKVLPKETLHAITEAQHQVKRGLRLNAEIRQTVQPQYYASEEQALLIWRKSS